MNRKFTASLVAFLFLMAASAGASNGKRVTDVHVHLAMLPDGANGCLLSDKMRRSAAFRFVTWQFGLPLDNPAEANRIYVEKLIKNVRESRYVGPVVLLAMDGVYTDEGLLDKQKTDFLIPNSYVLGLAHRYPQYFKAGVSINPHRRDAVQELERCVKEGAVLVKILPNTQIFNPSDPSFIPFYQAMAKHHIPLLCHIGYEFALAGNDQSLGDPKNLRLPLEQGVTVIAAHGMSYGLFFPEKYWDLFQEYVRQYPNFYWDASALSLPDRVGMLLRLRHHPELWSRMVFGTDYPLPSFAYPALLIGHWHDYWELRKIKNPFDRHYRLLQILGLPESRKLIR